MPVPCARGKNAGASPMHGACMPLPRWVPRRRGALQQRGTFPLQVAVSAALWAATFWEDPW
jgi:hypothetical protein